MKIDKLKTAARRAGELFMESLDSDLMTDGSLTERRSLPVREQIKAIRADAQKHPGAAVVNTLLTAAVAGTFAVSAGYAIYTSSNKTIDRQMAPQSTADGETVRYRSLKTAEGVSPSPNGETSRYEELKAGGRPSDGAILKKLVRDIPQLFKDGGHYVLNLPGRREPIKLQRGATQPTRESGQERTPSK